MTGAHHRILFYIDDKYCKRDIINVHFGHSTKKWILGFYCGADVALGLGKSTICKLGVKCLQCGQAGVLLESM